MESNLALKNPTDYNISGKVAIVTTMWHSELVQQMRQDALEVLQTQEDLKVFNYEVMGTVELANAAIQLFHTSSLKGIILMGAVIRGETPHFDYVCQIISQSVATLNTKHVSPTIFGVLTVDTLEQAQDRVYGQNGHSPKGKLDALALLQQLSFIEKKL